jgi:hypothetical protein
MHAFCTSIINLKGVKMSQHLSKTWAMVHEKWPKCMVLYVFYRLAIENRQKKTEMQEMFWGVFLKKCENKSKLIKTLAIYSRPKMAQNGPKVMKWCENDTKLFKMRYYILKFCYKLN